MDTLFAIAAAAQRSLVTLVPCVALGGLVLRRVRGLAIDWFDAGSALLLALGLAWLVREIVRPRMRETRLRHRRVTRPSTSGADLAVDAAFLVLGALSVWTEWTHPSPDRVLFGFGTGLLGVPAVLMTLRLVHWRRRPTAG